MPRRLDAELVHRGLARSREAAKELIEAGQVVVAGLLQPKPASQVRGDADIRVTAVDDGYVSRGAYKLLGALERWMPQGLVVAGRRALDAGASTGGFTQVLLQQDVADVLAVDVGYGVLAWEVRTDPRVHVFERMNIRQATPADFPFAPDLVVADLSFISLRTVLPSLVAIAGSQADFVLMVKPQFEVGREAVGSGVVHDPALRAQAVLDVATAMQALGLGVRDVVASPLPGPSGNVEYFVWATRGVELRADLAACIDAAVMEGPA